MIVETSKPTAADPAGDVAEPFEPAHPKRKRRRRRARARTLSRKPVFVAARFCCQYCGADLLASVDAFVSITRDHLVSRSHGGKSRLRNLVCCCAACNRLKANELVYDVAEAREAIAARREKEQAVLLQLRELVGWSGET